MFSAEPITKMSENKYAIVTGASRGMGKYIALELARRNINLILISLPDQELDSFAKPWLQISESKLLRMKPIFAYQRV